MGLGIPPLEIQITLESNPLKSRILVRRLAVLSLVRSSRGSVSEGYLAPGKLPPSESKISTRGRAKKFEVLAERPTAKIEAWKKGV